MTTNLIIHRVQETIIRHGHFHTSHLIRFPSVQTTNRVHVSYQEIIIESREISLENPTHRQPAGTHIAFYIISIKLITHLQGEFVGHGARNQHTVAGHRIRQCRNLSFLQMCLQVRPVVFLCHPLHNHSLKVISGHDHTRFRSVTLHVTHLGNIPYHRQQAVVCHHRIHLVKLSSFDAGNHNIRAHTYHLVAHLMLEADDHRHRHNHHGQSDSNTGHRNAYGRF